MSQSIWKDGIGKGDGGTAPEAGAGGTFHMPEFGRLESDRKTEVLIVGGGLCGLLCAYFLKQAGVGCMVVEADRICSGVSENTTAKITSQHGLIYSQLIQVYGREKAGMYLQANEAALGEYRKLAAEIDCDFEEKDAYTYSLADRKTIEDEVHALQSLGFPAEFAEGADLSLPFQTRGAVRYRKQAQFHPLKFAAKIAEDLDVCEYTLVRDISRNAAYTDRGTITADKILSASHFPFLNRRGNYFLKLYQHRSYVTALQNAQDMDGMYADESKTGLSFRNYGNLLLLGGGSHRTGKKGGGWKELEHAKARFYPESEEICRWAAQDCMSLDGAPYIGPYSRHTPDFFVATGFNKWGMTSSMAAALLLTDLVQGRENEWSPVFAPDRSILHPQLFVNGIESVINLLTPSLRRCPHLGCALKWNPSEHTWDCPCHGSRFSGDGSLIDNPAKHDARV